MSNRDLAAGRNSADGDPAEDRAPVEDRDLAAGGKSAAKRDSEPGRD
ncbi:MAG: hypothetical protein AB1510_13005 [Bacillota bacterium]